jgi:histidyl-tRNA synthetase
MRDLLPADMRAFRRVEDAFRGAASRWGYEEIRTPVIEPYSVFTAAGGLTPQMLSRVYSFLDWDGWSGERVVLRPDSTIPVARAAAEAGIHLPARHCYVQNVFRFSTTDDREDWQCGVEYLGAPAALGDVEVAAVACETLDALGIRASVRLGHVGVPRAVANAIAAGGGDLRGLLDSAADGGLATLRASVNGDPKLAAFVDVALQPGGLALVVNLTAIAREGLPEAVPALAELGAVAHALDDAGLAIVFDFAIPRDFEYYTGAVFEVDAEGEPWGRGGRYAPGGAGTADSACGLALDAGRLAEYLAPTTGPRLTVAVVPGAPEDMGRALSVARALHRSGISAALQSSAGSAPVKVTVTGDRLVAQTPGGERTMAALDDVVGLLVQFK